MSRRWRGLSLFEQSPDRAAAVVYFLGAVVPLGALCWLVVMGLHPREFDPRADWFIAVLGLIGILTLLSFFALRRVTRLAARKINREIESQSRMLEASRALAAATDAEQVYQLAAAAAASVSFAPDGFVLTRNRSGGLEWRGRSGSEGDSHPHGQDLLRAAEAAMVSLRPAVRTVDDERGLGVVVAVPCAADALASAALAIWIPEGRNFATAETDILSTLGCLTAIALGNAGLREAERNFFTHTTHLLVKILDRYLDDRSDHSSRVAAVANEIARALQLPEKRRERLHFAALLHDIGMLHIPRSHADDRVLARRHVELGDEMLRPIRMWADLAPFVRHHHEKWDGSGYPDSLAGEQIPLESRIIAIAEAFDVMTAEKSYKPAIPVAEALDRIERAAGAQFDPSLARAFLESRRSTL